MELGNQIKAYRNQLQLSQEALADKIYVSRQTISNWENDRNYPDIKSLLLLSATFGVTLDTLVKGDLTMMKEQIKNEDIKQFNTHSIVFTVLLLLCWVLPMPLIKWLGLWGLLVFLILAAATFYYALVVERFKKEHDIQTLKEIVAYVEGKHLNRDEQLIEKGKRMYQKVFLGLGSGVITTLIAALFYYLLF